jgi:polyisoprenyl-phosphate glycosyltransferase
LTAHLILFSKVIEKQKFISVVVPVYQGQSCLEQLTNRIFDALQDQREFLEIIFVEDGSQDSSWDCIQNLCLKSTLVKGILLSRNFGQHYAITAGLDHAKGDWVVVMDCDLQDKPEEIPRLLAKAEEGYDVVLAKRMNRRDGFFKVLSSQLFFKILSYLSGKSFDPSIGNFGIYHRKVILAFNQMKEPVRVFSVMISWMGFRTATLEVQHASRAHGSSSYSFRKRMNLALDIILAYSDKPIRLMVKFGLGIAFMSFLFACITLLRYLGGDITVSGYTSLILSISFFSGILMMMVGIVGLYVGKIFEGVKGRPLYLIDQIINE